MRSMVHFVVADWKKQIKLMAARQDNGQWVNICLRITGEKAVKLR